MAEPRVPGVSSETLHAACVAMAGRGVLIEARDVAIRTQFALHLIDRGGTLVAGDQTLCQRQNGQLIACAPAGTQGRIEVAGLGIIHLPHEERVPVSQLILLTDAPTPYAEEAPRRLAGIDIPVLALATSDLAGPIKVAIALGQFPR